MSNESIIDDLREIMAWAAGLQHRCRRTIEKLEDVSTPSGARKGKAKVVDNEFVKQAITKRNQRLFKTG